MIHKGDDGEWFSHTTMLDKDLGELWTCNGHLCERHLTKVGSCDNCFESGRRHGREQIIRELEKNWAEQRILAEHRKHPQLEWAKIALAKIRGELKQ